MLSGLKPFISDQLNGAKSNTYENLILKWPKSILLSLLDVTCSDYLIGILIQAEKNCNHP